MKVSEAVELLETDIRTFKAEARVAFPEAKDWNESTELPDELVERLLQHSTEYKESSAPAPVADLPKSEITTVNGAIANIQLANEALEYAFLEASQDSRLMLLVQEAYTSELQAVDAIREVRNEVWLNYFQQEQAQTEARLAALQQRAKEGFLKNSSIADEQMGKFAVLKARQEALMKQMQSDQESMLSAFFNQK